MSTQHFCFSYFDVHNNPQNSLSPILKIWKLRLMPPGSYLGVDVRSHTHCPILALTLYLTLWHLNWFNVALGYTFSFCGACLRNRVTSSPPYQAILVCPWMYGSFLCTVNHQKEMSRPKLEYVTEPISCLTFLHWQTEGTFSGTHCLGWHHLSNSVLPLSPLQISGLVKLPNDVHSSRPFLTSSTLREISARGFWIIYSCTTGLLSAKSSLHVLVARCSLVYEPNF